MPKISFWGSPPISAAFLEHLLSLGFDIGYVVTQPDKARSRRGQKVLPSPVKKIALKYNIPVITPERLIKNKELYETMQKVPVDFHVILAYGKIISEKFFSFPPKGSVNFHASLLPRWRGASPIEASLLHGDSETGWSLQKVTSELDAGEVYSTRKIIIDWEDNFTSLYQKLQSELIKHGPDMLKEYHCGKKGEPQNQNDITHFGKLDKAMQWVDWNKTALDVHNQCRAFEARGNLTQFRGKNISIKINLTQPKEKISIGGGDSGKLEIIDGELWVQCQEGRVMIETITLPGKKEQVSSSFINGYQVKADDYFLKIDHNSDK